MKSVLSGRKPSKNAACSYTADKVADKTLTK
jgi:hypothetical protein